jgi:hypothetical protein
MGTPGFQMEYPILIFSFEDFSLFSSYFYPNFDSFATGLFLKSMAIALCLIAGSNSMEVKEIISLTEFGKIKEMTLSEKNAYKMMLFQEELIKTNKEGYKEILPLLPKDAHYVIGGILHELTRYPV